MAKPRNELRSGWSSACNQKRHEGRTIKQVCSGFYGLGHGIKQVCCCPCHKKNKTVKK